MKGPGPLPHPGGSPLGVCPDTGPTTAGSGSTFPGQQFHRVFWVLQRPRQQSMPRCHICQWKRSLARKSTSTSPTTMHWE
eukprot:7205444-Heterocapsa_arctica.AAC.1